LQNARASLFEIEQVQLGTGFDAADVLSGDKLHVREISGTAQLKKWDVLFAWVMRREDHFSAWRMCVPKKIRRTPRPLRGLIALRQ
jgi:hypothetical protein